MISKKIDRLSNFCGGGIGGIMDAFAVALNGLLVEAFYNVLRLEELALRRANKISLSISEMHLIESVGKGIEAGRSISELADDLSISRPSATIAVGKLEKKGFVRKSSCESDGRVVRVFLTREGEKVEAFHRFYHRNMVKAISEGLTGEEKNVLLRGIKKINEYFKISIGEYA
jgi:DNA-binding MarR family transcriptional regulator